MSQRSNTTKLGTRRNLVIGAIAIVAVAIAIVVVLVVTSGGPESAPSPVASASSSTAPSPSQSATPTPREVTVCPLDGMPVAEGYDPVFPALAVQFENHPDARPGRNLNNADIVIEATVEGDTTRFTALFLCDQTDGMTGPVRSARYYNVDLWQDLHVLTVGYGASPGAVDMFVEAGMPYPNGIEGLWPWYQRFGPREAPHNLYVDLEAMRDALESNAQLKALADQVDELRPPFAFADEPNLPSDGRAVGDIEIRTNSFWYFGFTWDPEREAYLRSDAGIAVEDEVTGDPVAPTSVVVQNVTQETVFGDPDPGGFPRRLQHLVGSGDGTLYTSGRAYPLLWERPTAADRTTWTFADTGEPVELPPGQVWLEFLPAEATVTER